jgi:large subunit ribosomal protein L17
LPDRQVIDKVFGDLSERFKERDGGFTRMYNLGPRAGDAAPMVRIELV